MNMEQLMQYYAIAQAIKLLGVVAVVIVIGMIVIVATNAISHR